jgi:PAS domain S-box-containing protein
MRILIVDDMPDARQVLRYMVEKNGNEPIEAENGEEGLRLARSSLPDLIISDALMPVMDGFKFLRAIKQEPALCSIPFVLYSSAYKEDQDIRLAMSLGANAYLFKPMDPVELWEEIKGILEKAKENVQHPTELIKEDAEYLRRYSEVVATKLEEKVLELEKALAERKQVEKQLANLNQQLENLVEKRTEQLRCRNTELTASEKRYRSLVETMHEGIFAVDQEGRLTYVNRQMSNMLGMAPEALIGKECALLIEAKQREVFETKLKSANGQSTLKFEINFTRSDGHIVSTLVTPTTLDDREECYHGFFAVVTDITHLKQLQTQLLHAQKLESIGQLAAGIAHEINTPTQYVMNNTRFLDDAFKELVEVFEVYEALLYALKNGLATSVALENVEMSREKHQPDSLFKEISEAFHDTFDGLERISNIVTSVKRFARPGQDATVLADLNDAIRNTIAVSTNVWKNVAHVEMDLDPVLPSVPCNISDINQVILNLIVNAAHAIADQQIVNNSATKGTIILKTRNIGNFVELRVTDTGSGIPEGIHSRIFDPFFTTRKVGKGTGQGLAIARTIITENHHGSIDFETGVGRGTTFVIRLPY